MPDIPTVQERTMKVKEVLMRAVQREISWIQAAEILGLSARGLRRWKMKFEPMGSRVWSTAARAAMAARGA